MSPVESGVSAGPDGTGSVGAGRTPVAAPAAAPVALVLAVGVIALGVVAVRDALVAAGALTGAPWISPVVAMLDGLTRRPWMIVAGAALLLVGLWWLVAAVKPRRRTEIALGTSGLVWIRPRDVARLAARAADDVDGVLSAHATATRRTVTVAVRTTLTDTDDIRRRVTEVVDDVLTDVVPSVRTKVSARAQGEPT